MFSLNLMVVELGDKSIDVWQYDTSQLAHSICLLEMISITPRVHTTITVHMSVYTQWSTYYFHIQRCNNLNMLHN